MLIHVKESAQGLVLGYPLWLGLLVLVLGIALAVYLARTPWNAKRIGPAIAAVLCVCMGVYWLTYRVTLTADGARAYAFLWRNDRVEWRHVESVALEQRQGRGITTWLVMRTTQGADLEINVSGLAATDDVRVREYIAARVKAASAR